MRLKTQYSREKKFWDIEENGVSLAFSYVNPTFSYHDKSRSSSFQFDI